MDDIGNFLVQTSLSTAGVWWVRISVSVAFGRLVSHATISSGAGRECCHVSSTGILPFKELAHTRFSAAPAARVLSISDPLSGHADAPNVESSCSARQALSQPRNRVQEAQTTRFSWGPPELPMIPNRLPQLQGSGHQSTTTVSRLRARTLSGRAQFDGSLPALVRAYTFHTSGHLSLPIARL